jgi:REP element-mobilizing transposase RayT
MLRKQENKNLCERILREVAFCHKIEITELTVMPDHIHIIVFIPPTMSVSQALHLLKIFVSDIPKGIFGVQVSSTEVLEMPILKL